jgi:tetratricopeptide (TPR) repeat protein
MSKAQSEFENENWVKVIEYFLLAIESKEISEKSYFEVGLFYLKLNDYQNALKYFKKRFALCTESEDENRVYEQLIICYFNLNDMKNASLCYKKAKLNDSKFDNRYMRFEEDGSKYLTSFEIEDVYYQLKTLRRDKEGLIQVWLKIYWDSSTIPREDSDEIEKKASLYSENLALYFEYLGSLTVQKRKEIEEERKGKIYEMRIMEFDCVGRRDRILQGFDYDKYGNEIHNYDFTLSQKHLKGEDWDLIVPGTVGEVMLDRICAN